MASKKRENAPEEGRTARGSGEQRGSAHTPPRARRQPPEQGIGSTPGEQGQDAPAAPSSTTGQAPRGLDEARHAAAQKAARQAEVMRQTLFPAMMADALGYEGTF